MLAWLLRHLATQALALCDCVFLFTPTQPVTRELQQGPHQGVHRWAATRAEAGKRVATTDANVARLHGISFFFHEQSCSKGHDHDDDDDDDDDDDALLGRRKVRPRALRGRQTTSWFPACVWVQSTEALALSSVCACHQARGSTRRTHPFLVCSTAWLDSKSTQPKASL